MTIPDYHQWRKVFLDTSVLFNLFNAHRSDCKDPTSLFVRQLIEDLGRRKVRKGQSNNTVTFYVSSVSLCEMLDKQDGDGKVRKIVSALEVPNVDFINFDTDVSSFLAKEYHKQLIAEALNSSALQFGWPSNDLVNAREWIYKDMMIVASAHSSACDVILTNDVKTFYPMAQNVGFPCAMADPSCFEITPTGKYILRYQPKEAEELYQKKKPKVQFKRN